MPDILEFLEILSASGVRLSACKLAMGMFHHKQENLCEGLKK